MKTFEIVTKKSRRKHLLKTISLSLLIGFVFLFIGSWMVKMIYGARINSERERYNLLTEIAYPNIRHDGIKIQETGFFSGKIYYNLSKDIAGVPISFGQREVYFTLFSMHYDPTQNSPGASLDFLYDYSSNTKLPTFTEWGEKNQLKYLKDMDGQLVEVAIRFDKKYTLGQIKQMIPENLKQNWYWIGTCHRDRTLVTPDELFGFKEQSLRSFPPDIPAEHQVEFKSGIQMMKEYIELSKKDKGSFDRAPLNDVEDYIAKFGDTDFTKQEEIDKLEFAGVILTGPAENFVSLENQTWIASSSIGASIQNQPYYQLYME
ncbi:anti sigma factor C-terminal domain-containing protein [Streptococcus suis]